MSAICNQTHCKQPALSFSSIPFSASPESYSGMATLINTIPRGTSCGETEEQGSNEVSAREVLMWVSQAQDQGFQAFVVALDSVFSI